MPTAWNCFSCRKGDPSKYLFSASVEFVTIECKKKSKWEPHKLVVLCAREKQKRHTKAVAWQPGIFQRHRSVLYWPDQDPIDTVVTQYTNSKGEEQYKDNVWSFVVQNVSKRGRHKSLATGSINLVDYINKERKSFSLTVTVKPSDKRINLGSIDLLLSCKQMQDDGLSSCFSTSKVYNKPDDKPFNAGSERSLQQAIKSPVESDSLIRNASPRSLRHQEKNVATRKQSENLREPLSVAREVKKEGSQEKLAKEDKRSKKDYPQFVNPINSASKRNLGAPLTRALDKYDTKKPASSERKEEEDYPQWLNPFYSASNENLAPQPNKAPDKDGKELTNRNVKEKMDYPQWLNPFGSPSNENLAPQPSKAADKDGKELANRNVKEEMDYPQWLNPFGSPSNENLAPQPSKALDKDGKELANRNVKEEMDYPQWLNPFGSPSNENLAPQPNKPPEKDDKESASRIVKEEMDYPPSLNPFGSPSNENLASQPNKLPDKDDKESASRIVKEEMDYPQWLNPFGSPSNEKLAPPLIRTLHKEEFARRFKGEEDYPQPLNPFKSPTNKECVPLCSTADDKCNKETPADMGDGHEIKQHIGTESAESNTKPKQRMKKRPAFGPRVVIRKVKNSNADLQEYIKSRKLTFEPIPFGNVPLTRGSEKNQIGCEARQGNIKTQNISSFVHQELECLRHEILSVEKLSGSLEGEILQAGCKQHKKEQERLIDEWCAMVNLRVNLMTRENDLKVLEKQEDLEQCCKILQNEIQLLADVKDWQKTAAQKSCEELLLQELILLVNKRDELVQKQHSAEAEEDHH